VLGGAIECRSRRTAVILSGANIDLDKLKKLI
jgi:threonine dehydratase